MDVNLGVDVVGDGVASGVSQMRHANRTGDASDGVDVQADDVDGIVRYEAFEDVWVCDLVSDAD